MPIHCSPGGISLVHVARLLVCLKYTKWDHTVPKKATPPKPPVTRSKTRNQTAPTPVETTDLQTDTTATVDAEYDTDELTELPTDSELEAVESEQGEENVQLEGQ